MMQSMTGFGKATVNLKGKQVNIEVRSLNSKQLDLNLRLSGLVRPYENEIRTLVSGALERGKIDVSVYVEQGPEAGLPGIDRKLVKTYYTGLKSLARELKAPEGDLLAHVLRLPEVLKTEKAELEDKEWKQVKAGLVKALEGLSKFRTDEGKSLQKELERRIDLIRKNLKEIEKMDEMRVVRIKDRLRQSVAELKGQFDTNRFEAELIYYMEKLDITEEKVRLKTHCDYFTSTMREKGNGRKLGFISQELGREINTIGSKANDALIQKLVVLMKDELEKIKEQINNIL
ncbi:MAG: YicC family protein [Bacteroidia bacterium]|nr:YicC family protein [Bacteroidia bacterium]